MDNLYNNLLQFDNDNLVVADKEFESTISFSPTLDDFGAMIMESPEYFSEEILISIYHYIITKEIAKANEIVGDIENYIVGRGATLNISYVLDLVGNGYEWIDLDTEEKISDIASIVRELVLDLSRKQVNNES